LLKLGALALPLSYSEGQARSEVTRE